MTLPGSAQLGKAERMTDAEGRYIEFCKGTFPKNLTLRGVRLVLDCAHGANYRVGIRVFQELGAEVIAIGSSPNGVNINDRCGATAPQAMSKAVSCLPCWQTSSSIMCSMPGLHVRYSHGGRADAS